MTSKNTTISIRLPRETLAAVEVISKAAGVSQSSVIKVMLAANLLCLQPTAAPARSDAAE